MAFLKSLQQKASWLERGQKALARAKGHEACHRCNCHAAQNMDGVVYAWPA